MATTTLNKATKRLLSPLIRIMVRYGVPFGEFSDIAKQVYVQMADTDFRITGRKQTISRIAMLTGIQRKEVSRLLDQGPDAADPIDASYNRGVRVISGWHHDSEFVDAEGQPAPLPFEGDAGSFSALVKRYSGDLTARAVVDELERVGSVRRDDDLIHLVSASGYVPTRNKEAQFNILGLSVSDLLETLDHNLENAETRLQLTTAYDNLPLSAVKQFRHLSRDQSLALLKQLEEWLAEHDRDANPDFASDEEGRYRAGIGIYYIEEQIEDREK